MPFFPLEAQAAWKSNCPIGTYIRTYDRCMEVQTDRRTDVRGVDADEIGSAYVAKLKPARRSRRRYRAGAKRKEEKKRWGNSRTVHAQRQPWLGLWL